MGIYRRALTRKMRTHIKGMLAFGLDRKKKNKVWLRDLNPDSTVYIVRHRKRSQNMKSLKPKEASTQKQEEGQQEEHIEPCQSGQDFRRLRPEQEDSKWKEGEDTFCRKDQHRLVLGSIHTKKKLLKRYFKTVSLTRKMQYLLGLKTPVYIAQSHPSCLFHNSPSGHKMNGVSETEIWRQED